jgi:FkbM family methyltransferase
MMHTRDLLRFITPAGLLEIIRYKHKLERVHFVGGNYWIAALSENIKRLVETARLDLLPEDGLNQPDYVVDIGAHIGLWSEAILKTIKPKQLIAVEPNTSSFAELQKRVASYPNAKLYKCAVGSKKAKATFNLFTDSHFNSLLAPQLSLDKLYPGVELTETVEVDIVPLDDLLDEAIEISIMKIDVQGKEADVLDGAHSALKRTRCVLLEMNFVSHYQGDSLFTELHAKMTEEFGFNLYNLASPYKDAAGNVLWTDAVYVNRRMAS